MKDYYIKKFSPSSVPIFQKITLGDIISSGGEGTVYKVHGSDTWDERFGSSIIKKRVCAKIYNPNYLQHHGKEIEKKISFMILPANRPIYLHDGPTELIQICYPLSLLYDAPNGQFAGLLMYFSLEDSAKMSIVTVDRSPSYYKRQQERGKLDNISWEVFQKYRFSAIDKTTHNRIVLVHNVASIIHYLHDTGKYVLVDIKPDNFLINGHGGVSLVDVDSIQVLSGQNHFGALVVTPEYVPPEYQNSPQMLTKDKTIAFDLFSMAVVFYQLLTGVHPFNYSVKNGSTNTGTSIPEHIKTMKFACGSHRKRFNILPQHKRYDSLPHEIKSLFLRAFEGKPANRPTAAEWQATIRQILLRNPHQSPVISKGGKKTSKQGATSGHNKGPSQTASSSGGRTSPMTSPKAPSKASNSPVQSKQTTVVSVLKRLISKLKIATIALLASGIIAGILLIWPGCLITIPSAILAIRTGHTYTSLSFWQHKRSVVTTMGPNDTQIQLMCQAINDTLNLMLIWSAACLAAGIVCLFTAEWWAVLICGAFMLISLVSTAKWSSNLTVTTSTLNGNNPWSTFPLPSHNIGNQTINAAIKPKAKRTLVIRMITAITVFLTIAIIVSVFRIWPGCLISLPLIAIDCFFISCFLDYNKLKTQLVNSYDVSLLDKLCEAYNDSLDLTIIWVGICLTAGGISVMIANWWEVLVCGMIMAESLLILDSHWSWSNNR